MPSLLTQFDLDKCPHCNVDKPGLHQVFAYTSHNFDGSNKRFWKVYYCVRCGGLVTAAAQNEDGWAIEIYPEPSEVDDAIPHPASKYLQQALNSLHAPAGAVMLAASAVDAMLKNKAYKDGSLKTRIDKAATDHLITQEMARWAHNVRLDANEQRHADDEADLPTGEDARQSLDFAFALGEFLFVLPSKVNKGLKESQPPKPEEAKS
jgi:hypothetical protein